MTTGELIVIYLNLFAAMVCIVINYVAWRHDHPFLRPVRAAVLALLVVYVIAYIWLLLTEDVLAWSKLMRGFSITAWLVVWGAPPALSTYMFRKETQALEEIGS